MSCEQAFRQAAFSSTINNMKSNLRQHETKLVDSEVVSHLPQHATSHQGKSMLSLGAKKFSSLYSIDDFGLGCWNVHHQHSWWTTDTPGFKLFTTISYLFLDGLIPKTMQQTLRNYWKLLYHLFISLTSCLLSRKNQVLYEW